MNPAIDRDEIAVHTGSRISWSAIFAGAILASGLGILFHVVGLAAGLTAIDANGPSSMRAVGIGTGVWSVIASLIALLVGGLLAARIAGPVDRMVGALHGAVLWALSTLSTVALFISAADMLLSNAPRTGTAAINMAGDPNMQASAYQMTESAGKGLWWIFFALAVGLVSAMLGASATGTRTHRRTQERTREVPLGPTAQVHP